MNDTTRAHRWPWILGILLLAGSAIGATWALNQGRSGPAETPEKDPSPPGVVCIGFVDGENGVANLHPLQQGRVVWTIKEGEVVNEDVPLLKLDSRIAESKVKEAQAALDNAKEQEKKAADLPKQHQFKLEQQEKAIKAAESGRKVAEAELKVKQDLGLAKTVLMGYESALERIDAMIALEQLKLEELKLMKPELEISRAKAEVAAKEAQLVQANIGLEECILKAPKGGGTVLRVMIQPGEVLGPNPKVPAIQFLPKVVDPDGGSDGDMIVRAEVLQEWAGKVKENQTCIIEDDTYAGPKWEGKVVRLSRWYAQKRNILIEPFMFNDVRTLECIVRITSRGHDLRIGQRVRVRIKTG